MSERIGVCGGCGARFKIPETFKGASAKCKKCGGVITIAAPAGAPAPARPEAAERAKPERAGGIAARHGARARAGEGGARGRRDAAGEKKKNPALLFGAIAGGLVILGLVGFMLLSDDEDPGTPAPVDTANASAGTGVPSPEAGAGAGEGSAAAGSGTETAANKEPEPAPVTTDPAPDPGPAPTEPEAAKPADAGDGAGGEAAPEELRGALQFEAFGKTRETTDAEWSEMQTIAEGLSSSGKARIRAMDKLMPYGIKAIPVLINSLQGLDLTDSQRWLDGYGVVKRIQDDLSFGLIPIPYHGDPSDQPEEINRNYKVLDSLLAYWNRQIESDLAWEGFLQRIEESKSKKPSTDE